MNNIAYRCLRCGFVYFKPAKIIDHYDNEHDVCPRCFEEDCEILRVYKNEEDDGK